MHLLFYFELELELELQLQFAFKLVFELPYRVINAELLAVVVGDGATYCMRQCSLNSSIRLIIDRASLFLRSLRIRSTSRAPTKLDEIGLIARTKSQYGLKPCTSGSFNYSASLQTFRQLFNHFLILYFLLQVFRAVYYTRTSCFRPEVVGARAF